MSVPTNGLPTESVVTDDDTIVGNDGGSTLGVTKQFAGTAFLRPEQIGEDVASQADVDAKVSKSGDTMTGDLAISNTAPQVTLHDTSGPVNGKIVRWLKSAGKVILRSYTDADTIHRTWLDADDTTGVLSLTGASQVRVPANSGSGTNQAAQITQRDPATGRLAIDGVEMGDTGWIDIASWTEGVQDGVGQLGVIDTDNFTLEGTAKLQIRRSRETVYFRMTGGTAANRMLSVDTSQRDLFTTNVWPSGFRMNEYASVFPLTSREQFDPMFVARATVDAFRIVTPSGQTSLITPYASWSTDDNWPSVFPWLA